MFRVNKSFKILMGSISKVGVWKNSFILFQVAGKTKQTLGVSFQLRFQSNSPQLGTRISTGIQEQRSVL